MWVFSAPAAVAGLIAVSFLPSVCAKPYPVHVEELRGLHNASQIEKRSCAQGQTVCGWYGALCCTSGQTCITDANNQAQCVAGAAQVTSGWQYYTTTYVETVGLVTKTSVYSSFVSAAPTTCSNVQSPCGSKCCDSGFYCSTSGTCALIAGGSSGGIVPTVTASAPVRPTSQTVVIVTYTGTPTTTLPFSSPIPTGATGGLVPVEESNGGLSGGAIAGIVIGVLLGVFLLFLLCLFCCARALFDTLAGIFGIGKNKRKHTHEETYVEEHHSSGGAASGGGRWYGQGPSRPPREKKSGGLSKSMGLAAGLGALALTLGLKRKNDRRNEDKSTTVSGSSYYYSDYTSSSSASSSDRHTRQTRQSSRR